MSLPNGPNGEGRPAPRRGQSDTAATNHKMGPLPPCVGRGGRCYGAPALQSAAFGERTFKLPRERKSHSRRNGRAVPPSPLFHICGRCCGRVIGGGGVRPGGVGRAAVELLCGCPAHPRTGIGVAK